jgi:hypothetical protein
MITQLFDQLDAVSLAHHDLATSMRQLSGEMLDIAQFLGMFRSWVGRLFVHKWYLVHFETVVAKVEDCVRDEASVFGEFVRMQTKAEDMEAMTLGSMLLKPVQRLMKYPLFFKVSRGGISANISDSSM